MILYLHFRVESFIKNSTVDEICTSLQFSVVSFIKNSIFDAIQVWLQNLIVFMHDFVSLQFRWRTS